MIKIKKILRSASEFFTDAWYDCVKHPYYAIRMFCRCNMNKEYFKMLWTVAKSYPFDYGYIEDNQYAQLEYMLKYMKKRLYIVDESYDYIIRYIKLAMQLNRIMKGETDTFTYDKDLEFVPCEDHPGLYEMKTDDLGYRCLVNVNVKNVARFIDNEKQKEYCVEHPHELYERKARYLYYKIMHDIMPTWWD